MPQTEANGLAIEYETHGPADAPAILCTIGLGMQLVQWPEPLIDGLVQHGLRVVTYDNRDIGLSEKLDHHGVPILPEVFAAVQAGKRPQVPYELDDMAADAIGLLDRLGIERAHIFGMSMGGAISQRIAFLHPERTQSLICLMAPNGNPSLPQAKPQAMAAITTPPAGPEKSHVVDNAVNIWQTIGSPAYPTAEQVLRERADRCYDRSYHPQGFVRQFAAVGVSAGRHADLARITAPSLVIHGKEDPLVPFAAGEDIARLIPGAELVAIDGMGHDMPDPLVPRFLEAITAHCRGADR